MLARRMMSWVFVTLLAAGGAVSVASSAQAAVPDRFGFALYSGGVLSEQWPPASTVLIGPPGRYAVIFPGQATPDGVVHVVAVHDALASPPGRWCQADAWGPSGLDEVVKVSCYSPGGALDPTPGFSVMFARSSGIAPPGGFYGYIHSTGLGGIIAQYNSVGAPNTVIHAGVGAYSVSFPGLGTPGPFDGGFQVTAVNGLAGARCKVAGWGSNPTGQFARIFCFNAAGVLADNTFTVSYQYKQSLYGPAFPPGRFGYLWNAPGLGPPPTNYNSSGAVNILAGGPPLWTVAYPNIAASPGNVQVTAYGPNPDFCSLTVPWVASGTFLVARVSCFNNAGAPAPTGFFASYSSRF